MISVNFFSFFHILSLCTKHFFTIYFEQHTDAEEAVDVVVVTVVEEDIADVPEVMVQEMKTLRMKVVMLKTKANQKDVEMVVIDASPEDSAVDQGLFTLNP